MGCEQLQGLDGAAADRAQAFRFRAVVGPDGRPSRLRKSKSGIATPKADMEIIRTRLKIAEAMAQEMRNENTDR